MLKLSLVLAPSVLCLVLPAAHPTAEKPGPRAIERTLLRQMNTGGYGRITRSVECVRGAKARRTFACTLVSVRSTTLEAHVEVVDGGLRTMWYPPEG